MTQVELRGRGRNGVLKQYELRGKRSKGLFVRRHKVQEVTRRAGVQAALDPHYHGCRVTEQQSLARFIPQLTSPSTPSN